MQRQEDIYRRRLLSFTVLILGLALFSIGRLTTLKNMLEVESMLDISDRIFNYQQSNMLIHSELGAGDIQGVENLIPGYEFNLLSADPMNLENVANKWESQKLEKLSMDPAKPFIYTKSLEENPDVSSILMPIRFAEECLDCHGKSVSNTDYGVKQPSVFVGDFAGAIQVRKKNRFSNSMSIFFRISIGFIIAIIILLIAIGYFIGWNSGYFALFRNKIKKKHSFITYIRRRSFREKS